MKPFVVRPISHLKGEFSPLGDKSIAHRSIIISSLSCGKTRIENFPANKDCLYTLTAFKQLGIKINSKKRDISKKFSLTVNVFGKGLSGLSQPKGPIFVGDSGTTLRLLLGVLAGQDFKTKLIAGKSLSHRPMLRVNEPLRMMGACINAKRKTLPPSTSEVQAGSRPKRKSLSGENAKLEEYPPIVIKGGNLRPISYTLPVASAQVKSAILLAGLYAKGKTSVKERVSTRDHTERMLKLFKAGLKLNKNEIVIKGNQELISPGRVTIPGDISSAAFFLVLAAIIPNSKLVIKNVSLNPKRTGIIEVLKKMGADIKVTRSPGHQVTSSEPMGDIFVKSSRLKGIIVKQEEIPSLIDELPILMVAACHVTGKTIFAGVGELRVKETDRINSMIQNLRKMGARISVYKTAGSENIVVQGKEKLTGARVKSFQDHRTALSLIVAGLAASGTTQIDDITCINKSFPDFISVLNTLTQ
jgi:3-phosphoshikimate 1-carboxyvinyltransferase